ncbi:MAG: histone deacetylase [Verrucomicrobiota bacterium]
MVIYYDPQCEGYATPGHPEAPCRTKRTAAYLKEALPGLDWRRPQPAGAEAARLAHTAEHWERLAEPADFDGDTAYHPGIRGHAARATGAALGAVATALEGRRAFSLMRPPGHHATANQAMGFCYLSHVAIAALDALRNHQLERVAVWDIDAHHGNGTEAILDGVDGALFCSVHQYPGYPGTGTQSRRNLHNWTVAPGAHHTKHLEALEASFARVLAFRPQLVIVSAGFDAYIDDPITHLSLRVPDFATCGKWLAEADLPVASVLEGGYSRDLPELVGAYLRPML